MISLGVIFFICFIFSLIGIINCFRTELSVENFWKEFWKMIGCASGLALSVALLIALILMI